MTRRSLPKSLKSFVNLDLEKRNDFNALRGFPRLWQARCFAALHHFAAVHQSPRGWSEVVRGFPA